MSMNDLMDTATPGAVETEPGATAAEQEVAAPGTEEGKTEEGTERQELTPEQKALKAAQRRIDRLTRDKYTLKAQLEGAHVARPATTEATPEAERKFTEQDVVRTAQELREIEKVTERSNSIAAAGEKAFPDFKDKVAAVLAELPLFEKNGRPTAAMEAIMDADKPEALLHYLGANPDVAADLAELSPARQARKIAHLENEIASAAKPEKKQQSGTAAPLKTVKPAAQGAAPDPKDTRAWIEYENARAVRR